MENVPDAEGVVPITNLESALLKQKSAFIAGNMGISQKCASGQRGDEIDFFSKRKFFKGKFIRIRTN